MKQRRWKLSPVQRSALRPKPCLLATHSKLQEIFASKLILDWSLHQISGWLKQHYLADWLTADVVLASTLRLADLSGI